MSFQMGMRNVISIIYDIGILVVFQIQTLNSFAGIGEMISITMTTLVFY